MRRIIAAKAVRQLARRLAKPTTNKSCATSRASVFKKPLNWKCFGEKPHQELAATNAGTARWSVVRHAALRSFCIPT
jgi:hypothetical protein